MGSELTCKAPCSPDSAHEKSHGPSEFDTPVLDSSDICHFHFICFKEYQYCFHKTKENLEQTPSERLFDFSEMYIFGKFEAFHRRLMKITNIFITITTYSVLRISKIEGLEVMATKYEVHIKQISDFHMYKWKKKCR